MCLPKTNASFTNPYLSGNITQLINNIGMVMSVWTMWTHHLAMSVENMNHFTRFLTGAIHCSEKKVFYRFLATLLTHAATAYLVQIGSRDILPFETTALSKRCEYFISHHPWFNWIQKVLSFYLIFSSYFLLLFFLTRSNHIPSI